MKNWLVILAFAIASVVASTARAALPGGISGAWFNPAQGGHGLSVEILDGDRAIVFWYVYDPAGRPIHLYIEGNVTGNTIQGVAYYNEGMRFGTFNPAERRQERWGDITLAFSGCNDATLTYMANGPAGAGYTSGTMPLTRLTTIADSRCELALADVLPAGVYDLAIGIAFNEVPDPSIYSAAVDPDGRLWATIRRPLSLSTHGPQGVSPMFIGAATSSADGAITVTGDEWNSGALQSSTPRRAPFTAVYAPSGAGISTVFVEPLDSGNRVRSSYTPTNPATVHRALVAGEVVGTWRGHLFSTFLLESVSLRFETDDALCIDAIPTVPGDCDFEGTWSPSHPGWTFFDFTVSPNAGADYRGRGWFVYENGVATGVTVVGTDGTQGLGISGIRP